MCKAERRVSSKEETSERWITLPELCVIKSHNQRRLPETQEIQADVFDDDDN